MTVVDSVNNSQTFLWLSTIRKRNVQALRSAVYVTTSYTKRNNNTNNTMLTIIMSVMNEIKIKLEVFDLFSLRFNLTIFSDL